MFIAVYALYVVLNKDFQNKLLLVARYFFYGCWDWRFLILIWLSSSLDFQVARGLHGEANPRRRRLLVALSVGVNPGVLFVFNYYGFFADCVSALLGLFGLSVGWTTLNVVLPVGISFYTFQTMSYTLDVYRRQLEPAKKASRLSAVRSLLSPVGGGPHRKSPAPARTSGTPPDHHVGRLARRVLADSHGLLQKIVLADNWAFFANEVFNPPDQVYGLQILAGLLAFAFQIYGDFSGYSDIARGVARLMGFDLMLNFRMPYFAVNPSDFWRRWHISLSTWLRDYLCVPLGGNRQGARRTCRNLFLTMLLGGLWHGAAWNFVAWGAYHGLRLIAHRGICKHRHSSPDRLQASGPINRIWRVLSFSPFVLIGWLLFRVNHRADVPLVLRRMFHPFVLNGKVCLLSIALFALPVLLVEILQERENDMLAVKRWRPALRLACYAVFFMMVLMADSNGRTKFIYFQF